MNNDPFSKWFKKDQKQSNRFRADSKVGLGKPAGWMNQMGGGIDGKRMSKNLNFVGNFGTKGMGMTPEMEMQQ